MKIDITSIDGIDADFGGPGFTLGYIKHMRKPTGCLPGWGPTPELSNAPEWYTVVPPQKIAGGMGVSLSVYHTRTVEQAMEKWASLTDAPCPETI